MFVVMLGVCMGRVCADDVLTNVLEMSPLDWSLLASGGNAPQMIPKGPVQLLTERRGDIGGDMASKKSRSVGQGRSRAAKPRRPTCRRRPLRAPNTPSWTQWMRPARPGRPGCALSFPAAGFQPEPSPSAEPGKTAGLASPTLVELCASNLGV